MKNHLLIIVCFIANLAFAQDAPLTLSEAVTLALNNNTRLQQEQNTLESNQVLLQTSMFAMAPSISATATAGQVNGNWFNQQEGVVINGTSSSVSGRIGANMDLFRGLSNINNLRSSQNLFESQEHTVERTKQVIISTVASQYLQALLNQELLKIAKENLEFQGKNLEMIRNEVRVGSKARVEEFNQISLVKTSELDVLRAEVNLRNSKTTLAQTLQLDPTVDFDLKEPSLILSFSEAELNEMDINATANSRDDVVSASLIAESNRYRLLATKSLNLPSLIAYASFGSSYNNPSTRNFDDQFRKDNLYKSYGLQLSLPIFNGFANKAQIVRDQIFYDNAVLNSKDARITATSEIQRAVRNYMDAKKNHEMSTAAMEAAEVSFRLYEESFELGLINLIEFSQSNRDYFRARGDLANARLTLIFQEILLKEALGTLVPEDITE